MSGLEVTMMKRIVELKAEIEALQAEVDEYKKVVSTAHVDLFAENARLKAEVERLRKAGDEVVSRIQVCTEDLWCSIHRWNAAKEGRPNE